MEATSHAERPPAEQAWLTYGVHGKDTVSVLADLRREIPTALLPSLLTATLGPTRRYRTQIWSGRARPLVAAPSAKRRHRRGTSAWGLGARSGARRG
jgi:hypothetical protein